MGFPENENLVEIPNNFVGESIEDVGSDENRSRISETEEESHNITEDPVGQGLDSRVPRKELL